MSVIEISIIATLVAFIITCWCLANIIKDKNEVIDLLNANLDSQSKRGDKWRDEYLILKGSDAIKDGYVIMLTTDAYEDKNIFNRGES